MVHLLFLSGMILANSNGLYLECQKRVSHGSYKSSEYERQCGENFDMPPAYLLKCLNFVYSGFPTELDKKSCQMSCANNKNWGPWDDFEIEWKLKPLVIEMRKLNLNKNCDSTPEPEPEPEAVAKAKVD